MKANIGFAMATSALGMLCSGAAFAQAPGVMPEREPDAAPAQQPDAAPERPRIPVAEAVPVYVIRAPVRAPRDALELGVRYGYAQGYGHLTRDTRIRDVAGPGTGVGVRLGVRPLPEVGVAITSSYEQYRAEGKHGTEAHGASFGAEATFHLAPYEHIDPVLSIGGGYRFFLFAPPGPGNNTLQHGGELVRVSAGLDLRISESVAIGPSIGASVNTLTWMNPEGSIGDRMVEGMPINTFVFAGVEGRFNLGGARQQKLIRVARR